MLLLFVISFFSLLVCCSASVANKFFRDFCALLWGFFLLFLGVGGGVLLGFLTSLLITRPTHTRPHGSGLGMRGISFEFTHTFEITH